MYIMHVRNSKCKRFRDFCYKGSVKRVIISPYPCSARIWPKQPNSEVNKLDVCRRLTISLKNLRKRSTRLTSTSFLLQILRFFQGTYLQKTKKITGFTFHPPKILTLKNSFFRNNGRQCWKTNVLFDSLVSGLEQEWKEIFWTSDYWNREKSG